MEILHLLLELITIFFLYKILALVISLSKRFGMVEKHYSAFDSDLVEEAHKEFKKEEARFEDAQYLLTSRNTENDKEKENKKLIDDYQEAEMNFEFAREQYFFLVNGNLKVFNGKADIQEIIKEYHILQDKRMSKQMARILLKSSRGRKE